MLDTLAERAEESAHRIAFTFRGEPVSFGSMWAGIRAVAGELVRRGIRPGDRIVVAYPNGPEFFHAFYGAQLAGGIAVPVFPGSGPRRWIDIARLCSARAILSPEVPDLGGDSAAEAVTADWLRVEDAPREQENLELPQSRDEDLAYIQYTSGSTGDPKGVEISHANVAANLEHLIAGMEITPEDVFVSWLPVHHDMGLVLMTMVPFHLRAELHLLPATMRMHRSWLQTIQEHGGTFTAAPDFAYRFCLRYVKDPGDYDLSSLRVALNAAEPVRAATIEQFENAFGLDRVMMPGYGLAEATVGVSMCVPGSPAEADDRGLVCVGPPFPGVEVRVIAGEEPVATTEVGEIVVRSAATTRGYFENPAATSRLFWAGDYLRTGDLGYLDERGHLFIVGRKKNIILHSGRNIAPGEVEETVEMRRWVRRSAAVGVDLGGIEGEQLYVFVESRERTTLPRRENQLRAIALVQDIHDRIGLRPARIYMLKPASIPLTANGKIRHAELRGSYLDGSLRESGAIAFPEY